MAPWAGFCAAMMIKRRSGYTRWIMHPQEKKKEIWKTIKKYKRRKSPGPDEIPMELFKEMNE